MDYKYLKIKDFSKKSNILKLLNNESVLCFLHKEFMENGQKDYISVTELGEHWDSFRRHVIGEEIQREGIEVVKDWMKQGQMWLEGDREPGTGIFRCRLTPDAFSAFRFFEELVGSDEENVTPVDSYFGMVVNSIKNLSFAIGTNPAEQIQLIEKKIEHYNLQIKNLKKQKKILERGGKVEVLDESQIQNEYRSILNLLRRMPADIMSIADNLHQLYLDLNVQVHRDDVPKKEIIKMVYEGRKKIDESDQGKTFRRFISYINAEETLDELLQALRSFEKNPKLVGMVSKERPWEILLDIALSVKKADKEINGIYNMINNYISSDSFESNREIRKMLGRICVLLAETVDVPRNLFPPLYVCERPERPNMQMNSFIELSDNDTVSTVTIKPVYQSETVKLEDNSVNEFVLKGNLSKLVKNQGNISLSELLEKIPPDKQKGIDELFSYLGLPDFKISDNGKKVEFTMYNDFHDVTEIFKMDDVTFSERG